MLECINCRQPLATNNLFCPACGHPQAATQPPAWFEHIKAEYGLTHAARLAPCPLPVDFDEYCFVPVLLVHGISQLQKPAQHTILTLIDQASGTALDAWQDDLLAAFGVFYTSEQVLHQALHCAMHIRQVFRQQPQTTFKLSLHLGFVQVRNLNHQWQYAAIGQTLQVLESLHQHTPLNTFCLSNAVHNQLHRQVITHHVTISAPNPPQSPIWQVDQALPTPPQVEQPKFINRQKALTQLMQTAAITHSGLGRLVVIMGRAGAGKTRLLEAWHQQVTRQYQDELIWMQPASFTGFPDSRKVLELNPSKDTDTPITQNLDSPAADNAQVDLLKIADAVKANHNGRQIILVLDDVALMRDATLQQLPTLINLMDDLPITICLAVREESTAPVRQMLASLLAHTGQRHILVNVDGFSAEETEAMLGALLGIENVPAQLVHAIQQKAEGNPALIQSYLQMLIRTGKIKQKLGKWEAAAEIHIQHLPDAVKLKYLNLYQRQPHQTRQVMKYACMLGNQFDLKTLKSWLARINPAIPNPASLLTPLEAQGLLKLTAWENTPVWQFSPRALQELIYRIIPQAQRQLMHGEIAATLEKANRKPSAETAEIIANHYEHAKNLPKAIHHLLIAAKKATAGQAYAAAECHYRRALVHIVKQNQQAEALSGLAESLFHQSCYAEAVYNWRKALAYYRETNHAALIASLSAKAARAAWWDQKYTQSLDICLDGLEALQQEEESAEVAALMHETGRALYFINQPEKAQAYCEQALDMAKRLQAFEVEAEALATIGVLPTLSAQQAMLVLEEAIKIAETHHLNSAAMRAYINLAAVVEALGEINLARDYRLRALKLGKKSSNPTDVMAIQVAIINASLWLADFDMADEIIQQIKQNPVILGDRLNQKYLTLLYHEALVERFKGNFAIAVDDFTGLIQLARQANALDQCNDANYWLAEMIVDSQLLENNQRAESQLDVAHGLVDEILASKQFGSISAVFVHCLAACILALKGDFTRAADQLALAREMDAGFSNTYQQFAINLTHARLLASQNKLNAAIKAYETSMQVLAKIHGDWWLARTQVELACYLITQRTPETIDQAQQHLRDALAYFKEAEINHYPELVIDLLRTVRDLSHDHVVAHTRINREMADAGRAQAAFFPFKHPQLDGWRMTGSLESARETSGDFFDFYELPNGNLVLLIADVGDKGAGAALYMAMSRTLFRNYAHMEDLDPAEVIREVNRRILADTPHGIFLTAVFAVLDVQSATLRYVNAGHNPPLCFTHQTRQISQLAPSGTLLGIFADSDWETRQLHLEMDDMLVFYTDGITEAENVFGDFFGNQRLLDAIQTFHDQGILPTHQGIISQLNAFTGSNPKTDDVTLMILQRGQ